MKKKVGVKHLWTPYNLRIFINSHLMYCKLQDIVRQQMNKGTFNYDISTKEDIQRTFVEQVVSRIEDLKPGEYYNAGIDNSFHHFIWPVFSILLAIKFFNKFFLISERFKHFSRMIYL